MEKVFQPSQSAGSYWRRLFVRDLFAGLTVGAVAVPQGMAYALIAGIRPEYGLYTAIVMTLLASVFGSSSHLINGPTNAISIVVFSAVSGISHGMDDPQRIQIVSFLAILVGLIQVLIALLKLGDLTRYISESVVLGFMAGASVLIALSQVPNLLGFPFQGQGKQHFLVRFWLTVSQGESINFYSIGIGAGAIIVLMSLRKLGRRLKMELPDMLLTLLLASLVVWVMDWGGRLKVIGEVPRYLPPPEVPPLLHSDWIRHIYPSASAIALLGLVEALAIAKSIAVHTRQKLDYNQQCLAEGLANLGGGFFHCMPGSGSITRSAINFQAGAATRMSGIIAALAVTLGVFLFAPLARFVPESALAGLLLVIVSRLVDRRRLLYCLRATRFDAGIAIATGLTAVFISIEFSILIGTFLSFLFFVPRAARLLTTELVVSPERVIRERLPTDPMCTKMALVSLEGELFFGTAPELEEFFEKLTQRAKEGVRIIVLRMKRARNPDMVCLDILQRYLKEMQARGATVLLCGIREDFAQALTNLRFHHWLAPEFLFLEEATTGSSTLRAVRRAYEILGNDRCPTCPRPLDADRPPGDWYYMI